MAYQFPTSSQRYDRYAARMQSLGRILGFLRRHPVLTAVTVLALIAGILGLLLSMGSFSGSPYCPAFHYGSTPQCEIRAFLSPIQYQYAQPEGEPLWQDGLPARPGLYRIRAVSRNGFGQNRYSEAMSVRVLPRPVEVGIPSGSFIYGEFDAKTLNADVSNLAQGDYATTELITEENTNGNYDISLKNLKICNESGEDVTDCYSISSTEGIFTMTKRPITVSTKDAQKVYDGEPWDQAEGSLTKGSLVQGDTLQIHFEPAPAAAGFHPLSPQCRVLNAAGQDVTAKYAIEIQAGTLTVQPRPIWVETADAVKVYDGTPLTQEKWSVTEGRVVHGHTLIAAVTGSQTNVGESPNAINLQIVDEQGQSVLDNYHLYLATGTLTVTPRPITIQSDSAEKNYDGTPLTCHRYTVVEDILPKHRIEKAAFTGSQTEVGSSANTFTVQIVDGNGIVATANYDITYVYGTLTVVERTDSSQGGSSQGGTGPTPKPEVHPTNLTVCAFSATKIYDGKGFNAFDLSRYTILSGELRPGHRLEAEFSIDENPVNPGQYRNLITRCRIYDENGRDVTQEQYKLHTIAGTLTILHRKITVMLGSATKVYDGKVLSCRDYWISEGSLLPTHELELTMEASLRDVGQAENTASGLRILHNGTDVTSCYEVTVIPGKLEITEVKVG